jgi:hypothetical protein
MNFKKSLPVLLLAGGIFVSTPAILPADAAGTVPASVQSGIDQAVATVNALDGLALAALVVSLTPLGAMLTLRFLHMVLARV